MLIVEVILEHASDLVTSSNERVLFEVLEWSEFPKTILIKAWKIHTTWHKHTLGDFCDCFQRSLNSIEDSLEDT